jgi:hypothetical protein
VNRDRDETLEDLHAVSQHMLGSTARIDALEAEKRNVEPNSSRFLELSDEIERLAEEMRRVSHAETVLAKDLQDGPDVPTVAEADERT